MADRPRASNGRATSDGGTPLAAPTLYPETPGGDPASPPGADARRPAASPRSSRSKRRRRRRHNAVAPDGEPGPDSPMLPRRDPISDPGRQTPMLLEPGHAAGHHRHHHHDGDAASTKALFRRAAELIAADHDHADGSRHELQELLRKHPLVANYPGGKHKEQLVHLAAEHDRGDLVAYFKGAKLLHERTVDRRNVLHVALAHGAYAFVSMTLNSMPRFVDRRLFSMVSALDRKGGSVLGHLIAHLARTIERDGRLGDRDTRMVRQLLDVRAAPTAREIRKILDDGQLVALVDLRGVNTGDTLFHTIARQAYIDSAQQLLDYSVEHDRRSLCIALNNRGLTPRDVTRSRTIHDMLFNAEVEYTKIDEEAAMNERVLNPTHPSRAPLIIRVDNPDEHSEDLGKMAFHERLIVVASNAVSKLMAVCAAPIPEDTVERRRQEFLCALERAMLTVDRRQDQRHKEDEIWVISASYYRLQVAAHEQQMVKARTIEYKKAMRGDSGLRQQLERKRRESTTRAASSMQMPPVDADQHAITMPLGADELADDPLNLGFGELEPFVIDQEDSFEEFTTRERMLLLNSILRAGRMGREKPRADPVFTTCYNQGAERGFSVGVGHWMDCMESGKIVDKVFRRHSKDERYQLRKVWLAANPLQWQPFASFRDYFFEGPPDPDVLTASHGRYVPLTLLRNYYGEKLGFYFLFACMITTYLLPLIPITMLFGISQLVLGYDNEIVPWNAVVVTLWGSLMLEGLKRKSTELAYVWGTYQLRELEEPRDEYLRHGLQYEWALHPVTGLCEPVVPRSHRIGRQLGSILPMVLLISLAVGLFYAMLLLRDVQDSVEWRLLVGAINGLYIPLLNSLWRSATSALTTWENHRTESQFEAGLILKDFLFEFTNSYISLFYVAFVLRDPEQLATQLGSIMIGRFVASTIVEYAVPRVLLNIKSKYSRTDGQLGKDSLRMPYRGLYDEFAVLVIGYGYIVLFGALFPLAALLAFLLNVAQIRLDFVKYGWLVQRGNPEASSGIGVWLAVVRVINYVAVFTNGFLIISTSASLNSYISGLDWAQRLGVFLVFSHTLLLIELMIELFVSDVAGWVSVNLQRAKFVEFEKARLRKDL